MIFSNFRVFPNLNVYLCLTFMQITPALSFDISRLKLCCRVIAQIVIFFCDSIKISVESVGCRSESDAITVKY